MNPLSQIRVRGLEDWDGFGVEKIRVSEIWVLSLVY
jgi:hypothetical protein